MAHRREPGRLGADLAGAELGQPLAGRPEVALADLADEPSVALPASAGPMRAFWLAAAQRATPALVGAEAATAEECYEAVSAGVGLALVAAGSAALHQRDEVVHRPVVDLPPAELAVLWRRADRRPVVRVAVDACCVCAAADR